MTGGILEVAYLFILIAAAAVVLILCGLLSSKAVNRYRQRARLKCAEENQEYFIRIQTGLDKEGVLPRPEGRMSGVKQTVVQSRLMEWIDRVEGVSRDKLISLCEELGFVDRDMDRLCSRWSVRKIRAAYCLGMMRSKRAAPVLLEELRKQKFDSSLFIIARSVTQCARSADDLEMMVLQIVKHRKSVHHMTADILEEFDGDLSDVLERLLLIGNPDTKRIALLCLDKKADIRAASSANILLFKESLAKGEQQPASYTI